MKNWLKIISLCAITLWSVTVWASYFDAKYNHIPDNYELSDDFWAWEAQGRLNLIDAIIDVEFDGDLNELAQKLITLQNDAYGVEIKAPKLRFVQMRPEANGLPLGFTIMNWRWMIKSLIHRNMLPTEPKGQGDMWG